MQLVLANSKPLDKDGYIHDKSRWIQAGEQAVEEIVLPFFIH